MPQPIDNLLAQLASITHKISALIRMRASKTEIADEQFYYASLAGSNLTTLQEHHPKIFIEVLDAYSDAIANVAADQKARGKHTEAAIKFLSSQFIVLSNATKELSDAATPVNLLLTHIAALDLIKKLNAPISVRDQYLKSLRFLLKYDPRLKAIIPTLSPEHLSALKAHLISDMTDKEKNIIHSVHKIEPIHQFHHYVQQSLAVQHAQQTLPQPVNVSQTRLGFFMSTLPYAGMALGALHSYLNGEDTENMITRMAIGGIADTLAPILPTSIPNPFK